MEIILLIYVILYIDDTAFSFSKMNPRRLIMTPMAEALTQASPNLSPHMG